MKEKESHEQKNRRLITELWNTTNENQQEKLYLQLYNHNLHIIQRVVFDRARGQASIALIEDLTIEAFQKFFTAIKDKKIDITTSTITAFMHSIANFHTIDRLRTKDKSGMVGDFMFLVSEKVNDEGDRVDFLARIKDDGALIATESSHRKETKEYKQMLKAIQASLGILDEKYRELIILRYFEGFTYERMAEFLTLPLGTVKAQLFRAREYMKTILQDSWQKYAHANDIKIEDETNETGTRHLKVA